jgi:hypothetical protein
VPIRRCSWERASSQRTHCRRARSRERERPTTRHPCSRRASKLRPTRRSHRHGSNCQRSIVAVISGEGVDRVSPAGGITEAFVNRFHIQATRGEQSFIVSELFHITVSPEGRFAVSSTTFGHLLIKRRGSKGDGPQPGSIPSLSSACRRTVFAAIARVVPRAALARLPTAAPRRLAWLWAGDRRGARRSARHPRPPRRRLPLASRARAPTAPPPS